MILGFAPNVGREPSERKGTFPGKARDAAPPHFAQAIPLVMPTFLQV